MRPDCNGSHRVFLLLLLLVIVIETRSYESFQLFAE